VYNFQIAPGKGIEILFLNKTGLAVPKPSKAPISTATDFKFSETYKEGKPSFQPVPSFEENPSKQTPPPKKVTFSDKVTDTDFLHNYNKESPKENPNPPKSKISFNSSFSEKKEG
jgi:hypothetical protein